MKLKRLFTAILSAALTLSLCAMPAMAEDGSTTTGAGTTTGTTGAPVWGTATTGTLTIRKYEQTSEQANANNRGTPLNDVEFTVYKLADIEQENGKLVYKPVTELDGTLTDADFNAATTTGGAIDSRALYTTIHDKLTTKGFNLDTLTHKKSQTTGKDASLGAGTVKFTDLELGIYMVAETKAPSQILNKSANFIVSIPMTEKHADGTYTWNYDVVAEPKNAPTYGGVTLVKTGRVAGDTAGTGISGVLFRLDIQNSGAWEPVDLDKVSIAKGTKVQTTTTTSIKNKGQIKTEDGGYINIATGLAPATYRFVELEAVDGYIANTMKATVFEVYNNAGTLMVKMGEDTNVTSINITNERPDLEKNIVKRNGATSTTHDADYGIGDKVQYTLTVKVPDTIASLNVFKITDEVQAAELYYNKDFVLTYEDGTGSTQTLDTNCYEITYTNNDDKKNTADTRTFTIDFKPTVAGKGLTDAFKDKTITIKYTAELLPGAKITNAGNINSAKLIYSNKTNQTVEGGETPDIKTKEIQDSGVVYTFQTGIHKVDESGNALSDVTFDLYKMCDDDDQKYMLGTDQVGIVLNGKNLPYITDAAKLGLDGSNKWVKVGTLTSNDEGKDAIKGLVEGTYKLVETETKEGYNLLKEPVDATLTVSYAENWTKTDSFVDGKLVKRTFNTSGTAFDNSKASTEIKIINRKGFTLPVTGGFGTLLFSGIGLLLVLVGVSVLFSLKKKTNRA